jgi:hypothetical protein
VSHSTNAVTDSVSPDVDGSVVEEELGELDMNVKLRKLPDIRLPSIAEQRAHFVTHVPYLSWCDHCVRGNAKRLAHQKVKDEERKIPEIQVD